MRTTRAKQLIGVAVLGAAVLAVALVAVALSTIVLRSGTGADPADAFSQISIVPEDLGDLVTWDADRELARPVEPTTRDLVEAGWVRAWSRVDAAQRSGDRELIDTWFLGSLADQVAKSSSPASGTSVSQRAHLLQVTFYSVDGSVMGLHAVSDMQRSAQGGPTLSTQDEFEVVMLLSDGNWRILHLTRLG